MPPEKNRRTNTCLWITRRGKRDVGVFSSRSGESSRKEGDDDREVSGQDGTAKENATGESSISDDRNSSNETQNTLADMLDLETSRSRISRFADQEAKILKQVSNDKKSRDVERTNEK